MENVNIFDSDKQLASFLKALANPVRLSILRTLMEKGRCPHGCDPCSCGDNCEGKNCKCGCKCGELVELFPMSQSTVSQHIKELIKAGLIETKGRKGDYTVNHGRLNEGIDLLLNLIGQRSEKDKEEKKCNCCHFF